VRDAGVPTPPFVVAERNANELIDWTDFPAFVKPLAEGTGKGCGAASLVRSQAELQDAVSRVIERYRQPALVERYLPGREFTVGIVGNGNDARVLGVCEILLRANAEANVYSLLNKELCEELVTYTPASDGEARLAATRALKAYRALECRDAARIDFRSDQHGDPHFLEANPLAGLNPWHSDLPILAAQNGIEFVALIGMILDAGLARCGLPPLDADVRRKSA
jgi:D-alanine-D-alanine ligase